MKSLVTVSRNQAGKDLKEGRVGIIPTDTMYGLAGSVSQPDTIERMYSIKTRSSDKPMVILISDMSDLDYFGITLSASDKERLHRLWPGPISVILPVPKESFSYLHRGRQSLAFRLPNDSSIREWVGETGPIATTSVNIEGQTPATSVNEAWKIFGDSVDFYVDGGVMGIIPSTLARINSGRIEIIRQGLKKIEN